MLNNELDSDFEIIEMYSTLEEYLENNNLKIYKKDIKKFDIQKFNKKFCKIVIISWGTLILAGPIFEFGVIPNLINYCQFSAINNTNCLIENYCDKEEIEYVNIFNEYDNLISDTASFYQNDLKIDNPIEAYICYTSMIKLGCFSSNYSYTYSEANYEVFKNYGINIIDGNGVCKNNASLLTDIMSSIGYDACTLCCNLIDTNNPIDKDVANHAVTVVKYNNKLYLFDPTNYGFFIKDNDKYIRYDFANIDIEGEIQFEESLSYSYTFGYINKDELFKLRDDFKLKNVSDIYDLDIETIQSYYNKYYLSQTEPAQNLYDPFYNKEAVKIKKISHMFDIIEKEEN